MARKNYDGDTSGTDGVNHRNFPDDTFMATEVESDVPFVSPRSSGITAAPDDHEIAWMAGAIRAFDGGEDVRTRRTSHARTGGGSEIPPTP